MKKELTILLLISIFTILIAVPRDMVIVEIGTGTWCQYCPGAAMGADDLVENRHRAAIVENHNGDTYANTYSNARNTYYGINSFPTAYFDGMNAAVGGSNSTSLYPSYRTKVNNRLNVSSKYTITANGSHTGTTYNVAVTVSKVELDTNSNIKLHAVLTESGIQQAWQGQTHLEYVVRLMAPSATGTDIDFSTNATQTVNLTFNALPAWNAQNFEFVFFLQNNTSKEILQGTKYSINALENVFPVSADNINFGDVDIENLHTRAFTINNWWTQDMSVDISVDSPEFFVFEQQRDIFEIPFMESSTFEVFFTPNAVGVTTANITITTNIPAYPTITIPITANVTSTAIEPTFAAPVLSKIMHVSPNPFRDNVNIKFYQNKTKSTDIAIFNVKGEKVFSTTYDTKQGGEQSFSWSGKDSSGKSCPSGIYFCQLINDGVAKSTQKLIKLK